MIRAHRDPNCLCLSIEMTSSCIILARLMLTKDLIRHFSKVDCHFKSVLSEDAVIIIKSFFRHLLRAQLVLTENKKTRRGSKP